jgi:hypothetical protein
MAGTPSIGPVLASITVVFLLPASTSALAAAVPPDQLKTLLKQMPYAFSATQGEGVDDCAGFSANSSDCPSTADQELVVAWL